MNVDGRGPDRGRRRSTVDHRGFSAVTASAARSTVATRALPSVLASVLPGLQASAPSAARSLVEYETLLVSVVARNKYRVAPAAISEKSGGNLIVDIMRAYPMVITDLNQTPCFVRRWPAVDQAAGQQRARRKNGH
jgi:hypothetical protein